MITALRQRGAASSALPFVVLEGHFGNHHAWHMARPCPVPRISTRRSDAALYWPYTARYAGRGPHRLDGSQLDGRRLPAQDLKATTVEGHLQTRLYQAQLRHQEFSPALHVVIIVKRHRPRQAWAPVILCRSARALPADLWRDDDGRRFQLELNVREAQPYWGVDDFMHVTNTAVTHAANLAWCMVNGSHRRWRDVRQSHPASGLRDLTAPCRGYTYVPETRQRLPETPTPMLLPPIFTQVAG